METVFRLDLSSGEVSERRRTQQGGLVAKANLTRTGIFTYRMPDGSSRRELRHPDEVFHPDSLATYPGATVTIDHPGRVTPQNYRSVTHGHVGHGARPNGDFVAGEVHLQDAKAIDDAENDKLREISCGYTCDIDPTPGTYRGEPYDVAQKNIRINHVALGPAGWGRMGPETRLRLDSNEAISGEGDATSYVRDDSNELEDSPMAMTAEEKAAYEKAIADAATANAALSTARQDAATSGAELATLRTENEALKLQQERARNDSTAAERQAHADAETQKLVAELVGLHADARMVFATVEDPEGKKWKADGKNAEAIRFEVIGHLEPKLRLDSLKGIADAGARHTALRSVYETVIGHKRETDKARAEAIEATTGRRQDGASSDDDAPSAAEARKAMVERKTTDWQKKDKRRGDARRSA